MNGNSLKVGVDIGGTFTDLVALTEGTGVLTLLKVPSTPHDPSQAVLAALAELRGRGPGKVTFIIHASTIGTNLFLGQIGLRLPKGALITTQGFRDVLEIGRQKRPELYNLFFERPRPLVERRYRFTVAERLGPQGQVLTPLNPQEVAALAKVIKAEGIETVAIVFLHSYVNPIHEAQAKAILQQELPDLVVVCSHEVDPEYREYERTSTTVVNALLRPVVSAYLQRLEEQVRRMGLDCPFAVMQSSGGLASIQAAIARPAATIESGPAAGVVGAAYLGRLLGLPEIMSFDMGGTTAKAGTVRGGIPEVVGEYEVGGKTHSGRIIKGSGYPVRYPFIDLAEVSAGGGTVAWVDKGGFLRVGPVSAGAEPGPACYGKGGQEPTVTDANLLLGRLGTKALLGGAMEVDAALARAAFQERIAGPLGLDLIQAASGVLRIVNTQMVRALRLVSVERGHDPRSFLLVAFGGAGPMHAAFLAEELGLTEVLVPVSPGLFSALGLVVSEFRHDYLTAYLTLAAHADVPRMEKEFARLEGEAAATLASEGIPPERMVFQRALDMRYLGQAYEITVPISGPLDLALRQAQEAFHRRHRDIYGYAAEKEPVELVNLRLTATGLAALPQIPRYPSAGATPLPEACRETRPVFFDQSGWLATPVYWRPALQAGNRLQGPAIVEQYDATTVLPPGWEATVDDYLNLRLRRS